VAVPPRPSTSTPASSPPGATSTLAGPPRYVFPVAGEATYAHTHHDYPAADIIADCGLTVRAVTDGIVLEVNRIDTWQAATNLGATRGGLFVSILGDDDVRYYGSHLSVVAPALDAGSRVAAGDEIGKVGRTGDASICHLHFGISPPCARTGDWAVRRGVVWPWPYLDSWRAGTGRSAVGEVAGWLATHDCAGG